MRDLMAKILSLAETEGGRPVRRVNVWLGALSHMSADHFREHYGHAAHGTLAETAKLGIEVSDDMRHPNAQAIMLTSIEVDT